MPRKPILLKYNKLREDVPLEGCGSHCADCVARSICKGCCMCAYDNNCHQLTCDICDVRCWQRKDLADWLDDIDGLEIESLECNTPYDYTLPDYIPQLYNSAFKTKEPVYIININKLVKPGAKSWSYRKSGGLKKHYNIPSQSKVIVTFASKDRLLEYIWTNSEDFFNHKTFWDGLAAYHKDKDINAAMSIEFSCFADTPRLEHLINIKRSLISAHEFSKRGIPVILDIPVTSDGVRRLTQWGSRNNIQWYMMNFQGINDDKWLREIIDDRLQVIFNAGGKAILNGLGKVDMIKYLMGQYKGKVVISNTTVSQRTAYYWQLQDSTWMPHSKMEQGKLFRHNLKAYREMCDLV